MSATFTPITIGGAAVDLSAKANAPRTWILTGGTKLSVDIWKSPDGGTTWQFVRTLTSNAGVFTENPVLPGTPILGTQVKAVLRAGNASGASLYVATDGSAAAEDSLDVPASGAGMATDTTTRGEMRTIFFTGAKGDVFTVEGSNDAGATYNPLAQILSLATSPYDARGVYDRIRLRRVSGTTGVAQLVSTPSPAAAAASGGPPSGPAGGILAYTGSTYPDPSGLATVAGVIPVKAGAPGSTAIFKADDGTGAGDGGTGLEIQPGAGAAATPATAGGNGGTGGFVGGAGGDASATHAAGRGSNLLFEAGQGGAASATQQGGPGGDHTDSAGEGGPGSAAFGSGPGGTKTVKGGDAGPNGGGGRGNAGPLNLDAGSGGTPADLTLGGNARAIVAASQRVDSPFTQDLTADADTIAPATSLIYLTASAGNRVLSSTPSIDWPNVEDGGILEVINVDAAHSIQLKGESALPGSGLLIQTGSVTLAHSGGNARFRFVAGAINKFVQVGGENNPT